MRRGEINEKRCMRLSRRARPPTIPSPQPPPVSSHRPTRDDPPDGPAAPPPGTVGLSPSPARKARGDSGGAPSPPSSSDEEDQCGPLPDLTPPGAARPRPPSARHSSRRPRAVSAAPELGQPRTHTASPARRNGGAGLPRRSQQAAFDHQHAPPPRARPALFMSTDHALRRHLAAAAAAAGGAGGGASGANAAAAAAAAAGPAGRLLLGVGAPGAPAPPPPPPPARAALSAPLPLTREIEARIQSLGTELPATHKAVLWVGVVLDVASKASLCAQLYRFASDSAWYSFAALVAFASASSSAVTGYWLSHYPNAMAERALLRKRAAAAAAAVAAATVSAAPDASPPPPPPLRPSPPRSSPPAPLRALLAGAAAAAAAAAASRTSPRRGPAESTRSSRSGSSGASAGLAKARRQAWVRRLGTAAAAAQLGTAFAAARALRASEVRQRLVAMDLRGMRLADTVFLTLGVAALNAYVTVRCGGAASALAAGHVPDADMGAVAGALAGCAPGSGRALLRLASTGGALISAALCHLALEMNDRRLAAGDRQHALQVLEGGWMDGWRE